MQSEFRKQIKFYLEENERKIELVWAGFSEQEIWMRPNEQTLSPANQLIHLAGNLSQWVLAKLGGSPDHRERDEEFATRGGKTKEEIYGTFTTVLHNVYKQLEQPTDLCREVHVQGHRTSEIGVWIHMVEHLSYHTAQLIFFAKQVKGVEFDFYADWDLSATDKK